MAQQTKKLDAENLKKLQVLEQKLGCCIVALESQPSIANLSEAQLQELQASERAMESTLIAYNCSK